MGNNLFVKESIKKDAQTQGIRSFVHCHLLSSMLACDSNKKSFLVPLVDCGLHQLTMAATDNLHIGDSAVSIAQYFDAKHMKTKEQLRVEKESNGEEELVISTHEKAAAILERIADSEDEPAQPSTPPQKKRKGMFFGNFFIWGLNFFVSSFASACS